MTKIISVYFNGTGDSNDVPEKGTISLAALLAHITETSTGNYSFCVNGCGESKDIRDLKVVFGFHLEQQVLDIAKQIKRILDECEDNIVLNVYGFSRGAIAAFLLCKKLKNIPNDRLAINVAAFEPVPVNFISSVTVDRFFGSKTTLTAQVADLKGCGHIDNIIVLFTNQPFPDIFGFAPVLPELPTTSRLEVDVTPGCHVSAVLFDKDGLSIQAQNNESIVVFHRIVEFMQKCGTTFNFEQLAFSNNLVTKDSQQLLNIYEELADQINSDKTREMHLEKNIFTRMNREYVNRHHQRLSQIKKPSDDDCILTIHSHTQIATTVLSDDSIPLL